MLEESFKGLGLEINAFALDRAKVFGGENFIVEQEEREAIDDGVAKFFDEIERERGPAIDEAVEEADIGIEALGHEQGENFIGEQSIAETEHGVDRVFGRAARTLFEANVFAEHLPEGAKIGRGGGAFGAHEALDGVEAIEAVFGLLDEGKLGVEVEFRVIAEVAADDGAAVGDFGFDDGAGKGELKGVVEMALVLGEAEENVFGVGRGEAFEELSGGGEKSNVGTVAEAEAVAEAVAVYE